MGIRKCLRVAITIFLLMIHLKTFLEKLCPISDEVMWDYFRLLLLKDDQIINELRRKHPMEAKKTIS